MKIKTKILIVLDVLAIICLFLIYGPITYFKDTLITTAMTTMSHQYLAKVFYSESMIEEVLEKNKVIASGKSSDTSHIVFSSNQDRVYTSDYEREILEREKDAKYKIIKLSGNGYQGYLVAIYDAKNISLALPSTLGYRGETLDVISKNNNAIVGINAGGFADEGGVGTGGEVAGILIKDSKILNGIPNTYNSGIIGFNNDGVLMLSHKSAEEAIEDGMVDGIEFGPFLIVNGESSYITGNGGMGIHPRTAIAQRKDGIVLFLVIDGRQPGYSIGASISEVTKILLRYGAYNAANLDGGASTTLTINGEIYNRPCGILNGSFYQRAIPNAWILK